MIGVCCNPIFFYFSNFFTFPFFSLYYQNEFFLFIYERTAFIYNFFQNNDLLQKHFTQNTMMQITVTGTLL